jgi:DHA3 family macrolide efflux protein-like MFS transporter
MASGVSFALMGLAWDFVSYLVFSAVSGLFLPPMNTAQTVYIQELTEPSVLGRVFSLIHLIPACAVPVAILLFGPLADAVSVEAIMVASGCLLTLIGLQYDRGKAV